MLSAATVVVVVLVVLGEVGESLLQAAVASAVMMTRATRAPQVPPGAVLSMGPTVFSNDDRSFFLGAGDGSESNRRTCRRSKLLKAVTLYS